MASETGHRIYRSPRQAAAFWLMFAFFGFIAVSNVLLAAEPGGKAAWGIFGIAICAVTLRGAASRVLATADQIEVRNPFGAFRLPWQAIERFEIGRSGLLGAVCLIHTRDGRALHAFAIQRNNLGENVSKRPASMLVAQLNDELAVRQGSVTSQA